MADNPRDDEAQGPLFTLPEYPDINDRDGQSDSLSLNQSINPQEFLLSLEIQNNAQRLEENQKNPPVISQYLLRSKKSNLVQISDAEGEKISACKKNSNPSNTPDTQSHEPNKMQNVVQTVMESVDQSINTVYTTLTTEIEKSHNHMSELLMNQTTQIQHQSAQYVQSIHDLTKSMALMVQSIPNIQANTQNIVDLRQQLHSIQESINTLHTQQQIPILNPTQSISTSTTHNISPSMPILTDTRNSPPSLQTYSTPTQTKTPFTSKLAQEITVPKFDGLNEIPSIFLKKLNKYFFLAGFSTDEYKIQYFEYVLSAKAAAWFQATEYSYASATWLDVQRAFLDYFEGPHHLELQRRNWDRYYLSSKDDIHEFILDSINFLRVTYPDSTFNQIAEMIIHKLPKNIRQPLRMTHTNLNSPAVLLRAVSDITRMQELEDEDDWKNKQNYMRTNPQSAYTRTTQPRALRSRTDSTPHYTSNPRSVNVTARTPQQAIHCETYDNTTPANPTQNRSSPRNPYATLHYPQPSTPSNQGNGNQSG